MFWKYNNASSAQLETRLAKEDVTLQEIMDEVDIINECKVQNKALIDYLVKPEILEELVTLTTTEPNFDLNERSRYKYSNIACEMITCDIPLLNERLAGNEKLLEKLYMFLNSGDNELNPLLASFFSKIMCVLIARKTEQNWLSYQFTCLQVLDFLKAKENFVELLLKHQGTSAIMDLTLKLMTQVEGVEIRQNILNYLDSQRIIQSLIGLLDAKIDNARHHNVAQLLCDFIQTARNNTERNDPDPLLNRLESPETIELLLDHMLNGEEKSESAIVGGIQVLLELLDIKNSIPKYDLSTTYTTSNTSTTNYVEDVVNDIIDRHDEAREKTASVITKRLKDIHNLLINPPKKDAIITTIGTLNPPLGNTRLQVTKLLAALISIGGDEIARELISLDTMGVLIDLFFAFPWNNFLHTQVLACITAALQTTPSQTIVAATGEQGDGDIALSKHLLVNCKLVERILKAWKDNDELQANENGVRQGYMGHLINIVNNIVKLCSEGPLSIILQENMPDVAETLKTFTETTLAETNRQQDALLGGVHPNTNNEDSDDYGNMPYPTGLGQQNFNDYQSQSMSSPFYETFGNNDDDFKDGDDSLQNIENRSSINFDLNEGDLDKQYEIFKQVCSQNINTLDDGDDQLFDDKEHTLQTVIEKEVEKNSSSDEDDFSPSDDAQMYIQSNWTSEQLSKEVNDQSSPIILIDDPWGLSQNNSAGGNDANVDDGLNKNEVDKKSDESGGWANFDSHFDKPLRSDVFTENDPVNQIEADNKTNSSDAKVEVSEVASLDAAVLQEKKGDAQDSEQMANIVTDNQKVEQDIKITAAETTVNTTEEATTITNSSTTSENKTSD